MTPVSEDVWRKLSRDSLNDETLIARMAMPEVEERVLAALDIDGRRHILIHLDKDDVDVEDSQSRGISVSTQHLNFPVQGKARFIDIVCLDASGHGALDVIAGEIGERLSAKLETPAQCVARVIAKWRRFWGAAPKKLLSREEHIGLFSELWFLLYWLIPLTGIEGALAWRGPSGSRHDFEGAIDAIEVKGTTSVGLVHKISNLTQLDPPENGALWFFSLQLREEAGATNTLPGLIDLVREILAQVPDVLEHFEQILERTGYSPLYYPDYDRIHFRIVEELLFKVDDSFPKLSAVNFVDGLPPGVESVAYSINLLGFRGQAAAKSASMDVWPVHLN